MFEIEALLLTCCTYFDFFPEAKLKIYEFRLVKRESLMKKDKNELAIHIIISRDISHFNSKLVLTRTCCECIVANVVNGFLFDFFFHQTFVSMCP